MKLQRIVEVFKAGVYPQGSFGAKELQELAESYDANVHEAPLTVGHTSDYKDSKVPAFGWVKKVFTVGGVVKVVAEFTEELAHLIKTGHYKKVSVGLYKPDDPTNPTPGKWHLHHVAFLGAAPPAVKGLESIAFTEALVEMEEVEAVTSEMNTADTFESIQQSFATCLSEIEDALKNPDIDEIKCRDRINTSLSTAYADIAATTALHFAFLEKSESIMEKMKNKAAEMVERLLNHNTTKESDTMDEKALKAAQDALAEQQASLDRDKAQFAEQKRQEAEAKATAEAAAKKQHNEQVLAAFREDCVKANLPVNKMEEQGVFRLAAQMLDAGQVEFSETDKRPAFEVFRSLTTLFAPVATEPSKEAEFSTGAVEMADAAKALGLSPGTFIPVEGMKRVQFAQSYLKAHAKDIAGDTDAEKLAVVLTKVNLGEIALDETLLK
jgi:hypothetical protein